MPSDYYSKGHLMSLRTGRKQQGEEPKRVTLGRRLKSLLERRGLTQDVFAADVKITRQYLSSILNGRARKVSSDLIRRICSALEAQPDLRDALIDTYTSESRSSLADEINAQAGKTVWLFSSRIRAAHDESYAKQVLSNINAGSKYVFWSDDENELGSLVSAIKPRANMEILKLGLTCITGPRWLRFMLWRVIDPSSNPSVYRMETSSLLPLHGEPADIVLGIHLWEYFSPIMEALRKQPTKEIQEFRLLFPSNETVSGAGE